MINALIIDRNDNLTWENARLRCWASGSNRADECSAIRLRVEGHPQVRGADLRSVSRLPLRGLLVVGDIYGFFATVAPDNQRHSLSRLMNRPAIEIGLATDWSSAVGNQHIALTEAVAIEK